MKHQKAKTQIYQLKVTLLCTDPPIWRRLLVPASLTLEQLHYVLQAVMGWQDRHLHDFSFGRRRFAIPDAEYTFPDSPPTSDERTTRLSGVLDTIGADVVYVYDPSDNWEHSIVLEAVLGPNSRQVYPVCIDGWFHAPPEDCGGVEEFEHLLRVIADRYHPEYRQTKKWLPKEFDPDYFSVDEVNQRLAHTPACR